jgi:hypothetical protein
VLDRRESHPPYELVPPFAGALIESLRGVGYSPATALADLIDNSISAAARNVWLSFNFAGPDSVITLLDDGLGMTEDHLRSAMTLGGVGPLAPREANDLGRFGLGMKTASFSQCRCLTVSSKRGGLISTRRWDLDYIARPDIGDWRLLSTPRPRSEGQLGELDSLGNGTLVTWQGLDRIVGDATAQNQPAANAFYDLAARIEQHLAMVFHRYLEGLSPDLRILIGGHRIKPWDPFLRSHLATVATPTETIRSENGTVELEGFVLPHKDQLGSAYEQGGGLEGGRRSRDSMSIATGGCSFLEAGSGSARRGSGQWKNPTSWHAFVSSSGTPRIMSGILTSRNPSRVRRAGCAHD